MIFIKYSIFDSNSTSMVKASESDLTLSILTFSTSSLKAYSFSLNAFDVIFFCY